MRGQGFRESAGASSHAGAANGRSGSTCRSTDLETNWTEVDHDGKTYYVRSTGCVKKFKPQPTQVA